MPKEDPIRSTVTLRLSPYPIRGGCFMPIFHFESKLAKRRRLMKEFATRLGQEAAKDFKYDPENDPVMADIFKRLGLPHPKKHRDKS